ncbi:MAG: RluA family pseudouridine synthase [Eubacteriales bacterium]|nr:RluA family pseudouridine synthase [Eubacteriales bacterium]MDD4138660.1 RluA family pseudouridine synthase [Eubacteriales bacterium]MDD4743248.1 RluA family pseudouridine synthase [Eubacteriales bacterium]
MLQHIRITESGQRLDRCLADLLPGQSRSFIQKLLAEGRATLNGKSLKPSWKTHAGAVIALDVPEPEPMAVAAQDIPLDVVFEDEYLIVVNKPQGMVVHPAVGHRDQTLVNALLKHCAGQLSDLNGVIRPGIVHRIDKDTSGLLLVVKDNTIHAAIADKIRRHEIRRVYQAVVHGHVATRTGTIDAPIGRDPRHRQRMAVRPDGKPAVSHFQTIQAGDKASWLEVSLETGRTHQIRVHLQYIGHPVVGDPVYAGNRPAYGLTGQALHAGTLSFIHPVTGQLLTLTCPVPDTFSKIAEELL